MTVAKNNYTK